MTQAHTRIRRIEFSNFKGLARFSLSFSEVNILVGPDNSGKSTVIGALRTLDAAMRVARSRNPSRIYIGEEALVGYRVPNESIPISLENVQTDYNDAEAQINFSLHNENTLSLIFPSDGGCILVPRWRGGIVTSAALFRREFAVSLVIVPVLGPVEHNEHRRERSTVVDGLSTHRASRHFRSFWHYNPEGFEKFAELVGRTWPGMSISPPEYNHRSGELSMFCMEGRMTRELYWVGFGFQIWCQLLTHLFRADENALIVVDEPEVYLHPDVQRQLLGIIRDMGADVVMATHSSEIIAEADPSELVMVDKLRRAGERLRNISGIQKALDSVGSSQNITLTALAKSRRVLFVEGLDDFRLLRRFARKLNMQELSSGSDIIPLQSGGFGSWQRITTLASGIENALGAPLMIGAVYDRDYYCDEQIADVLKSLDDNLRLSFVFQRKEIENYLLLPAVLDRATDRALGTSGQRDTSVRREHIDCAALLDELTTPMKEDVLSQLMARRHDYFAHTGQDKSKIYKDVMSNFEIKWTKLETRMTFVPSKEVLRILRDRVQGKFGVTLTDARIVEAMNRNDIPLDMSQPLSKLEVFRTSRQGSGRSLDPNLQPRSAITE